MKVSVYLITYNNERTVEKALQSVRWADEIVVVDSFSTDATPQICRRYTERVYQREWKGFREQYQYAADLTSHPWIMFIDADEEIPPPLAKEIKEELERNRGDWDGYMIPRQTYYLGRWIRHGAWAKDREVRLYDRNKGRWEGGVYAKVKVKGRVKTLQHPIFHYTYEDISHQVRTLNLYSGMVAEEMYQGGRRFRLQDLLLRPPLRFFRDYILKRGFMDGIPGLVIALSSSYYVFLKYAKLWERGRR